MSRSTDFAAGLLRSSTVVVGHHREVARLHLDARLLDRGAHRVELGRRGRDLPGVAEVDDVVGARVGGDEHEVVLVRAALVDHRPRRGGRTATTPRRARRTMPPLRLKMFLISAPVRLRLSVSACTKTATPCGRVALVVHRLVDDAFFLAGAAPDRALDRVDGHRRVARLLHHRAQRRVRFAGRRRRVRAATSIWRISTAKSLPRAASAAPFLCLIECHLE